MKVLSYQMNRRRIKKKTYDAALEVRVKDRGNPRVQNQTTKGNCDKESQRETK